MMNASFVKTAVVMLAATVIMLPVAACKKSTSGNSSDSSQLSGTPVNTDVTLDTLNLEFTDRDLDSSYNSDAATKIPDNEADITITGEGCYLVTGTHTSITVNAADTDKIQIVLKDATVTNSSGPAIYIKSADKVFMTLADGTVNTLSDGSSYSLGSDDDNVDAVIFSKADFTVNGSGTLEVTGNYKSGIVSKDDLTITGGIIKITSVGCAVEGKDCVKITDCTININSGGDGIRSSNEEDSGRGFVYITGGNFDITAVNDGIQAATILNITGGTFRIKTGGGSATASSGATAGQWGQWGGSAKSDTTDSAKGLKAKTLIMLANADFTIDSSDDSLHSNSDLQIDSGTFAISSGDDAIHADDALLINDGTIDISKSYEGLEGTCITITGGNLSITASDDGLNAAGGNDSSAMGGRPGENTFNSSSDAYIQIDGGYIVVNASGDGVDSNGSVAMTNGVLLVSGPTDDGNGAFDYDSSSVISGGTVIMTGSSGMAQTFSDTSKQYSVMYTMEDSVSGGTSVAITDKDGTVIASFLPSKQFTTIVISSPQLSKDSSYKIVIGGTVTGCDSNGYASAATVSGETNSFDVTISSISTTYGNAGMGGGRMPQGGDMGGGMGKPMH